MDKRIILAKAGSGKTYYICNNLDFNNNNLILAFTNQNIRNIIRELEIANNGIIPSKTTIMTFHKFVYHTFVRPYELIYSDYFSIPNFISQGVEVSIIPEPQVVKNKHNYKYQKKDKITHYYTKNLKYVYVGRMSELPLFINNKENMIIKQAIEYLNKFYEYIYVDEVQDFREYDWDLLEQLIKGVTNITLVGDFYQHSVTGANNFGRPFMKNDTEDKYINYLTKLKVQVDTTTLSDSRRCPPKVCELVTKKTGIQIKTHCECKNTGNVNVVNSVELASEIIHNNDIIKLVWDKAKQYHFKAVNWSYSKGDTYDSICVILTKEISKSFFSDDFKLKEGIRKNKLYVALTRTCGNLYIMSSEIFEKTYKNE